MSDILARDNIPIAVNQVEFSILRQLPEKSGLLAEMKKRNITCLGCESRPPQQPEYLN
jgi:diketogulonate reductase-like aldo/keto reductase